MSWNAHVCGWEDFDDLVPEHLQVCLRPTIGYIPGRDGERIYCCVRHVDWARERAKSGILVRVPRPDDTLAPTVHHAFSAHA